jgi:taurine dioxygenase
MAYWLAFALGFIHNSNDSSGLIRMKYDLTKYRHIRVMPCGGVIGAEIDGVEVGGALDEAVFAEIRRAFNEHHVIFFRDQKLDARSLAAFAERFAPLTIVPFTQAIPEHPMVTRLYRAADLQVNERNIGDRWHSDQAARERPNMAFALYCLRAPPYGGDTLFASLCEAYERLSAVMKDVCADLIGIHSLSGVFGADGKGGGGGKKPLVHKGSEAHYKIDETLAAQLRAEVEHPLVRTHPETGRLILYVSGDYLIRFRGMTDLESAPLIAQLNQYAVRPEFTCRFRWRSGSLAVMDNRCTQHYAVNDYAGFEREMLRTEMEGERPYGPAMPRRDTHATDRQ